MNSYNIPRNYRGEGRILYIFSTKGLLWTAGGIGIGLLFYFLLDALGFTMAGVVITIAFGIIAFSIGTFKIPDTNSFEITKKAGGENIDVVIKRWIKFKRQRK